MRQPRPGRCFALYSRALSTLRCSSRHFLHAPWIFRHCGARKLFSAALVSLSKPERRKYLSWSMARKAAWEDASDLGPYAKSGRTSWGRVFVLVLAVGMGTFVAAYYLPLFRAQQKLSEQYRDLSQKSQGLSDAAQKAEAELKSVSAERDQLRAEHDQRENAKKTEGVALERVRTDLSTKLDKLVKKGSALVLGSAAGGGALVALDAAALFMPLKLDLSPVGKALLCDVGKSAQGLPLRINGSMAEDATVPAAFEGSFDNAWALSAARAAAVAAALEDRCAIAGASLSAVGNGKHDPFQAQLVSLKAPERIVIEIRSR